MIEFRFKMSNGKRRMIRSVYNFGVVKYKFGHQDIVLKWI